ncbi:MAG: hypothetical protein HY619_06965 [Thaumarchaeota archaeon]|nr:hypothetical protein [Nitrososphaerota archaeon]
MPSKVAAEDLLRVIDLCRVVGTRGVDPFQVDVEASLKTLKTHLPNWRLLDELLLDSEALNSLSSIVRLQGEWLKRRASALYIDPVLVELKIRLSSAEDLANDLAESLHPIVRLNQIFSDGLKQAIDYWNRLLPLSERQFDLGVPQPASGGALTLKDLLRLQVLVEEEFEAKMQALLEEARDRTGENGRMDYWDFLCVESFSETVIRAYVTSFLVSEGQLVLQVDPLEERTWLTVPKGGVKIVDQPRSVTTRLSYGEWSRRLK